MNKIHAIACSGLSKKYTVKKGIFSKKESFLALDNISFTLQEGETLGILGESGAGKTSLAKILVGDDTPSSGLLMIDNKDITQVKTYQRLTSHRKIRMVFQDPNATLNPRLTIASLLEEPLRNITTFDDAEIKEQVIKVLNLVGLKSEHGRRFPYMLSAGERQRIALARALILDPVCIVLDEPLSSLDISVQSQIVNLMLELQKNLGLSYVLITYNLPILKHMCDQLMIICKGQMVEYGPARDIIDNPIHPYTKDLLIRKTKLLPVSDIMDASFTGCIYCDRCERPTEPCFTKKPEQKIVGEHFVYCHKTKNTEPDEKNPANEK